VENVHCTRSQSLLSRREKNPLTEKKKRERKAKKEDGIKEVKTAAKILSSSS